MTGIRTVGFIQSPPLNQQQLQYTKEYSLISFIFCCYYNSLTANEKAVTNVRGCSEESDFCILSCPMTSNLDSAAKNFGLEKQISHDERYDRGDEFLEVAYKLWNASWEEDAVVRDRAKRIYAQPEKVHEINHKGKFFEMSGIHLTEPSPQRTPVIFQAGSSDRGREFAPKHAECIFLNPMTIEETRYLISDIRQKTAAYGRKPEDILFFPKINPIVGKTDEEVQEKLARSLEYSLGMYQCSPSVYCPFASQSCERAVSMWKGLDYINDKGFKRLLISATSLWEPFLCFLLVDKTLQSGK
jgi:hypothetical protein